MACSISRWLTGVLLSGLAILVIGCDGGIHGGRVIVTVNGEPITENEFETELDYQLTFRDIYEPIEGDTPSLRSQITLTDLKKEIFAKSLIPMALVRIKYRDRMAALMEKLEDIKKGLAPDGSDFKSAAAEHSQDTNAKTGGDMGTVPRMGLPYPASRYVFEDEDKVIVGPVASIVGCHLFRISGRVSATIPSGDTVRLNAILLPYDPENTTFLAVELPKLVKEAKIEVKVPEYAGLVK